MSEEKTPAEKKVEIKTEKKSEETKAPAKKESTTPSTGKKEAPAKKESTPPSTEEKPKTSAQTSGNRRSKFGRPSTIDLENWKPKTELGREVLAGNYESLDSIWDNAKVIREPEIVDFLLPGLEERILKIGKGQRPFKWVQRMTDSGRRSKYFVAAAVGDKNGYVGFGIGRAKDFGGAISQAMRRARLNLTKVEFGSGSWDEASSEGKHSIPYKVTGKCSSVSLDLLPAPKGTGLVANKISSDLISLAGISDLWTKSRGHTKTRVNMAAATFNALKKLSKDNND
ncbi:TPA: 30S ribosomal protein S5 [archaeon]|jgi:small subunit ribosomal protein S5|uniref:Small ribosomal subunit protein uS5 n=1 Tax=Candidatus Undinarchaeum marinum TaxID=2756141 RepID=A0A832V0N7_9ARCH|nr:30S ribosomal protein S5 [Candidatus Undinarchaeum marinum]